MYRWLNLNITALPHFDIKSIDTLLFYRRLQDRQASIKSYHRETSSYVRQTSEHQRASHSQRLSRLELEGAITLEPMQLSIYDSKVVEGPELGSQFSQDTRSS